MKKYGFTRHLAGVAAVAMLCAAVPAMELNAAQTLAGDVDQDGTVGVTDLVLLQKYLLGTEGLNQDAYDNANVLEDDSVDAFDLAKLKRMLTGTAAEEVANTVYLHLNGDTITAEGDENQVVTLDGTTAKITASGIYYVDGSITDGQIFVETAAEDIADVEIVLTDTTFENSTKSTIYTSASTGNDKTKLTLIGTNTMTDTAQAAYTAGAGVIFSNNKLSITRNSTGTLDISSWFNAGINGEKKINLNGGTINIDTDTVPVDSTIIASADGINSDKNVEIDGAVVDIDASADGIKSDASIIVTAGDVQVKAGNDAMQAVTSIDISGGAVIASGDRGFRLTGDAATGVVGALNLTGGTIVATATDYQVTGAETISMDGSTQTIMLLDMAAQWKKANAITIGDKDYTARKKYDYVLISDSTITADGTYTVAIGGAQAKHAEDASGVFQNTGLVTQYTAVEPIA